jgi:hypothetical protein
MVSRHVEYGPRVTYRMHHTVICLFISLFNAEESGIVVSVMGDDLGGEDLVRAGVHGGTVADFFFFFSFGFGMMRTSEGSQTLPFIIGLCTSLSTRCSCSVVYIKTPIRPGLHHRWEGRSTKKCRMRVHPTYR